MKKLLENKRIRLRATEPEDLELLYSWENDTEMWKNGVSVAPFPVHPQAVLDRIHTGYLHGQTASFDD